MNDHDEKKSSTNRSNTEEIQLSQEFLDRLNSELGKVNQANKESKAEVQKSQDSQKVMNDLMHEPDDESAQD